MKRKAMRRKTITVAGVTFDADEVDSVVIRRDGRLIEISEDDRRRPIGFAHYATDDCPCPAETPDEAPDDPPE